jgi:ribose transport system substrate-binding protein
MTRRPHSTRPHSTRPHSTRSHRTQLAAAVAALGLAVLTACGNSASGSTAPAAATSPADVTAAKSAVDAQLAALTQIKAPGGQVTGLGKFSGGTIAYIPITLKATYFEAELEQITQAVQPLGLRVQVCDAQAQPTVATQCLDQAVSAKSVGIITDSLPFALAKNSYASAVAAGIPIVASDVSDPLPPEWAGKITTTDNGQDVGSRLMADAIIADSGGTANVLFVNTTSTSTTKESSDAVLDEFAKRCPGCKVQQVGWEATAVQKIPTAVSVALNSNPGVGYVYTSYDQPAGPLVIQGMQLSGRADKLKLVGYGADVSAMQRIAGGNQFVDVAADPALIAWNNTDRLLRMMSGAQVPPASEYTVPRRVFNSSNVGTVNGASVDEFKNGAWFTDGSFRQTFHQLWSTT